MKEKLFLSIVCGTLQIMGFICIMLITKPIGEANHLFFVIIIIAGGIAAVINWFLIPKNIVSTAAAVSGIGLIIAGFLLY
jgi:hypothetical protein